MTKPKMPNLNSDDGLAIYDCWFCSGDKKQCLRCQNSRKLIYVNGYAFSHTPEGAKLAKAERAKADAGLAVQSERDKTHASFETPQSIRSLYGR